MVLAPDPGDVDGRFARRRCVMAGPRPPRRPPWDGAVVRFQGEVDIASAPALRSLLAGADARDVLVDLAGVTFMDCAGLSALLQARAQHAGRLTLRSPPPSLRRILVALDIVDAFTIMDGEEVAAAEPHHVSARSTAAGPR